MKINEEFVLQVDYTQSIEQLTQGEGFAEVASGINTKNFSMPPQEHQIKSVVSAKLLYYNSDACCSDCVIKKIEGDGFLPGNEYELLAFAKTFPELQKEFPIIALSAEFIGRYSDRLVLGLFIDRRQRRSIFTYGFGRGWKGEVCFLAIRK